MQAAMASSPLSPEDFAVYSWLRLTGPITPGALAADLGMHQPTMSNHLRRMYSRGHLRRRTHPSDGRSQLVSLTPSGRRVTERSFPGFRLAIDSFRARLHLDEAEVQRVLDAVADALEAAVADVEGRRPGLEA